MKFITIEEAEDFYYTHFAKNNEDFIGCENWLEEQEVEEIDEEEFTLGSMDRL